MSASQPLLDEEDQWRRVRHRHIWVGVGVALALMVAAGGFIVVNAGRWGVPMFPFTNDYGSSCRNDWLGHSCTDLTRADLERHLGLRLPDETTIVSSRWKQTHDYELTARLVYPQAMAPAGREALTVRFGPCREGIPSALRDVPNLSSLCVMTNEGGGDPGADPGSEIWRVATATQADDDTVVDIQLRSR